MDSDSDNDNGIWNFKVARSFLRTFNDTQPPDPALPDLDISSFNPKADVPKSLGDLDRLFLFCGKTIESSSEKSDTTYSSSPLLSAHSTPPSSATDDNITHGSTEHFDDFVARAATGKGVRWKDEVGQNDLADFRRRSVQSSASQLDSAAVARLLDLSSESDTESDVNDTPTPTPKPRRKGTSHYRHSPRSIPKSSTLLISSSVTPLKTLCVPRPPPIPLYYSDPKQVSPLYTLTNNEQKAKLIKNLAKRFANESTHNYSQAIARLGGPTDPNGIHVFVDLSNIVICFWDRIKANRRLPFARHPPLSFSSLALILERGRKVARRVLAGSTMSLVYDGKAKLPDHVTEAEKYGYELNILERVTKPVTDIKNKKRHGTGTGYATSGNSSASESAFIGRMKNQEQAVDELLQMKILESIVDTGSPSTIVLASGDAAEAEYSGGFLKNVERALFKGWKVEVVAWKDGLSQEYRSPKLRKKWGSKLTIIELDEFCEEMLGIYISKIDFKGHPGHGLMLP